MIEFHHYQHLYPVECREQDRVAEAIGGRVLGVTVWRQLGQPRYGGVMIAALRTRLVAATLKASTR